MFLCGPASQLFGSLRDGFQWRSDVWKRCKSSIICNLVNDWLLWFYICLSCLFGPEHLGRVEQNKLSSLLILAKETVITEFYSKLELSTCITIRRSFRGGKIWGNSSNRCQASSVRSAKYIIIKQAGSTFRKVLLFREMLFLCQPVSYRVSVLCIYTEIASRGWVTIPCKSFDTEAARDILRCPLALPD